MKFNLEDLDPRACSITVEIEGEKKEYRLRKFNLLAQIWVRREFGTEKKWEESLNPKSEVNINSSGAAYIEALCKTLHFLLEEKSDFPTWEDFAQVLGSGPNEVVQLGKALLVVLGMSQPLVDNVGEAAKKKMKAAGKEKAGTR